MFPVIWIPVGILYLLFIIHKWCSYKYNYFAGRGIRVLKPRPFVGNSGWIFTKINMPENILRVYNLFPNERVFGSFDFREPYYYLRDPALIKQLTVKDFDYFQDRRIFINPEDDKIFGSMLVSMKGKRWREMRSTLSPAFTGSKMRLMFELVSRSGHKMVQHFCDEYEKNGKQSYDMKDIFSRYANDVIADCAFGLECDSLKFPNNGFYKIGKQLFDFEDNRNFFRFLILNFAPKISKLFNLKYLNEGIVKLFHSIIKNTIDHREKYGYIRQDMVNLLIQLKSTNSKKSEKSEIVGFPVLKDKTVNNNSDDDAEKKIWTDDELIAQCFLFFWAGFDTNSTLLAFTAYELAMNTDIQRKLQTEIDEMQKELKGNFLTYDTLQTMKYLDMVVAESLRKWPPAIFVDRLCVKDYNYKDPDDGLELKIEKGIFLFIPILAIHRDPKYFPKPNNFIPERFSEENKNQLNNNAYMPFGLGPRNCIGSRFALMEAKSVLYYLLSRFSFGICEKTPKSIKFKRAPVGLVPEEQIILELIPRNKFEYTNDIK